jgi:hypothetical protein
MAGTVALIGVRLHDNLAAIWYSVYPEKQAPSCIAGIDYVTVVFGGKNTGSAAQNIRGQLIRANGTNIINYAALVQPGETHVYEQTFEMPTADLKLTVSVSGPVINVANPAQTYTFTVKSLPHIAEENVVTPTVPSDYWTNPLPQPLPAPPNPSPEPQTFPTYIPVVSDVVNWVSKGAFPDFKLLNLSAPDFGNMLGVVGKSLADTIAEPLKGLPDLTAVLGSLPDAIVNLLGGIVDGLINGLFIAGSDLMNGRILSTLQGTPETVKETGAAAQLAFGNVFERYQYIGNPEKYVTRDMSNSQIRDGANQQLVDSGNVLRDMDLLNVAISLASLGQVRVVADEIQMLEGMFNVGKNVSTFYNIRQEKAVNKRLERYFNEVYVPEIPNVQDLINMVVKEKMSITDFKQWMLQAGFEEKWSQLIWDAHFNAPDLNDVLTAWRRGIIDEKRVDELMILIDLDPRFKEIFDVRKYQDPPLMITRLMFETGAISAADVPNYVHRLGYAPEFESALTEFVLHFQERRYRTRYITQAMTALAQEKITEEELRTSVTEIGFTTETADLIVKTALLRRKTYVSASTGPKEAALSLSELKKAYSEDIINEDFLRQQMLNRNYSLEDTQIVIDLLNKDKAVESAGRRQVALTTSEMMSAWRYGTITEDELRTSLLGRGLDLAEVDILIATKKKQWQIGNVD